MRPCQLDHITVTAPSLDAGAAMVSAALGVSPQVGGAHARMGALNLLLRLGDTQFLEVIAPDPAAPAPTRPRWFALDTVTPSSARSLSAWVARCSDIHAATSICSELLGLVERMNRLALLGA